MTNPSREVRRQRVDAVLTSLDEAFNGMAAAVAALVAIVEEDSSDHA